MNVLSLFNGMGFGRMALDTLGVDVDKYYSSEIDKYANQAAQALFPDTIQIGDVTKWREWDIDLGSIDLLIAGFPCQAWSMAGKQKGDSDPRGALVHDLIDIWNEIRKHNPNMKFMFENVRMKKEFLDYINDLFGVDPICINSALVSAQNRNRYYWTNIDGVEQPEDKRVVLADVIEGGVVDREKSYCIGASYATGSTPSQYFRTRRRQIVLAVIKSGARRSRGDETRTDNKANTLLADGHQSRWLSEDGVFYRKLTVRECARLQTVPEHHIDTLLNAGISNSQLYKMLGNGWTHDVITHIFKGLNSNFIPSPVKITEMQMELAL